MTATATSPETMGAQDFQTLAAINKAVGDPLRLEILRLLRTESMGVLELTAIFESKQSGMSHHLKVLARARLVSTRREGNSIFHRRALPSDSLHGDYIHALFQAIDTVPLSQNVQHRLDDLRTQRGEQSRAFFTQHFHTFRQHQEMIAEHALYTRTVLALLGSIQRPANDIALELGPGEGYFLPALSRQFRQVFALDNSADMLDHARATATRASLGNITFILGEISDLLAEQQGTVDCLIANMVLHHIPTPDIIFQHSADILKPGGSLIISELSAHDQHWVRESCGDLWLGFREEELTEWALNAGLTIGESQYLGLRNGFQIQVRCFRRPPTYTVIN